MPRGRVKWYDPDAGEGMIEHGGRDHPVREADIEKKARVPGAPVDFDVEREGSRPDMVERAVSVTLAEGSRVDGNTKRFGDLSGAKRPGDKRPLRNKPPQDAQSPPDDR